MSHPFSRTNQKEYHQAMSEQWKFIGNGFFESIHFSAISDMIKSMTLQNRKFIYMGLGSSNQQAIRHADIRESVS